MQTRTLGNSDLKITPIGIGAWAMGGSGWAFAWGPQDDKESIDAIHAALDMGINWIDTAAVYGLGHSEEVVAEAVKGRQNKPYIFTKCERRWDANRQIYKSLKAASIREECEASLRRLNVDTIDLYQIHWPEPEEDIEEGWTELAKLKTEGKVRYIGVSNFNVAQMKRAAAIVPITSLQPPYNLLTRDIEAEILPYVAANNIGILAYSPMKSGLLTGKMTRERVAALPEDDFRKRAVAFQEPQLSKNLATVEVLKEVASRNGVSPGEAAIAWVLRRPEVTAAIVGMRSPAQAEGVKKSADFRLSTQDIAALEASL